MQTCVLRNAVRYLYKIVGFMYSASHDNRNAKIQIH